MFPVALTLLGGAYLVCQIYFRRMLLIIYGVHPCIRECKGTCLSLFCKYVLFVTAWSAWG